MQITVSEDRMSAQVGDILLKVGGPISYKNYDDKLVNGSVVAFAIIDKKDMKAPWAYVQETKTNELSWISLTLWSELNLPSQEVKAAPIVPVDNQIADDDLI